MVIFEHFQTVRCWLDVIEIWRIVFTRDISYKLVNIDVSKMAFAQKIQVRLNREGGILWQLLRDYVSDLHHTERELKAHIRDLDFLAVLRLWLRIERAAEARINTSTISTCWFKKQLVNKENCKLGTSVYCWMMKAGKCWYLSLDLCLSILYSLRWVNASQN